MHILNRRQVLVRVAAAGVNPVDTYIREGQYAVLPTLPYTPGRDGAGIVEEVGEDVSHVKVGDRVYFLANHTGSAAEYCLTDKVFPLPFDLTFQEGACLGIPYMTAHRALFLVGHLEKGQRVLVHGSSGGVGLAAVQLAANFGAVVVGTAGTEEGIELVRKNGACHVFNHRVHGYSAEMKTTHPDGFDLILEMAAHLNLATDLDLLARNGKVAVVGSRGEVTVNPRALMTKESSVDGVTLANSTEEDLTAASNFIWNFLCSSLFRPMIHRIYPLSEIATAHSDLMAGSGTKGKLIVHIADL
ncbi:putative NADPH:quinone reductase [Ancylostoma caninum]|uniref:Putative NADPH:quinone reductase n=1 Tax=Ancylostoma caninum TaxID=29170 RepID=A0A368FCX6_ANCCA|nr:putative NADPH:quinone reductase [Ancylostoma caninum]